MLDAIGHALVMEVSLRWGKYGAMVRWPLIFGFLLVLGACAAPTDAADTACGWDLTTAEGVRANQERLTFVTSFLMDNPGQTPPPIDSPYWFGDCPMPTDLPTSGPDHEDESPHDDEDAAHGDASRDPAQQ